jgi:hypothetical protein
MRAAVIELGDPKMTAEHFAILLAFPVACVAGGREPPAEEEHAGCAVRLFLDGCCAD